MISRLIFVVAVCTTALARNGAAATGAPAPREAAVIAAATGTATTADAARAAASDDETSGDAEAVTEVEEVIDFEAEEVALDQELPAGHPGGNPRGHPGPDSAPLQAGFKLFVDLLADYRVGPNKLVFRPNHSYVLVQGNLGDEASFLVHVSDAPVFYEVTWNVTPRLAVKAGKLLIPFGINEFHHLIGGRIDELSSFLPETWGDFGLAVQHLVHDGDVLSAEYAAYVVNGFEGSEAPIIGTGDATDNNLMKGIGARLRLGVMGKLLVTGSIYYDRWDPQDEHALVFYAVGAELRPRTIDLPVLRRLRLRGEWARGELQLPHHNYQRGLLTYAVGRGGFFAEALLPVVEPLSLRVRIGRVNPDNTARHDPGDVDVWEPAVLLGFGKLSFTLAYQMVARVGRPYHPKHPSDALYAKFFLQY